MPRKRRSTKPRRQPIDVASRRIPRLALTVQYAVERSGLPARSSIEKWTSIALIRPAELTVRFVATLEARALNRVYRGRDYATNVLSFVYRNEPLAGDIVLCAPVVAREARAQRCSPRAHYAHLIVHGLLHLQGHDHERAYDAQKMESLEAAILAKLGYPDPYE